MLALGDLMLRIEASGWQACVQCYCLPYPHYCLLLHSILHVNGHSKLRLALERGSDGGCLSRDRHGADTGCLSRETVLCPRHSVISGSWCLWARLHWTEATCWCARGSLLDPVSIPSNPPTEPLVTLRDIGLGKNFLTVVWNCWFFKPFSYFQNAFGISVNS